MSLLLRSVKAVWNEVVKPESFVKGDEFEQYVRDNLFPKTEYTMIQRTHDFQTNRNDFVETSKEPDFKFRCSKTGKEFYVEAKFRSYYRNGGVEWCKDYQLERYKEIAKDTPVYVVIGVGEEAGSPEKVFLIPLDRIKYTNLFKSFLKEFEVPTGRFKIKPIALFSR